MGKGLLKVCLLEQSFCVAPCHVTDRIVSARHRATSRDTAICPFM
jgi:hypothetical protein